MIKVDLVNQIVARTGVSKTKAEQAVDTIFGSMKQALKRDDRIELRGFGVFFGQAAEDWDRSQSSYRIRSQYSPG